MLCAGIVDGLLALLNNPRQRVRPGGLPPMTPPPTSQQGESGQGDLESGPLLGTASSRGSRRLVRSASRESVRGTERERSSSTSSVAASISAAESIEHQSEVRIIMHVCHATLARGYLHAICCYYHFLICFL
jgi:hypothetical protein